MRILITGSNKGLGYEFVKQFLQRGEEVIAACRQPEKADKLAELKQKYPDKLTILQVELENQKSIEALANELNGKFDSIDLLINNAGIRSGGSKDSYILGELYDEDLVKIYRVNAFAPVLLTEKILPLLKKGTNPKVVNITSQLGSISLKNWVYRYSYCSSKAALNMLSKLMALQLKDDGIIVIPLHPGHVQTDLGGWSAPLKPEQSIGGMIKVIDSLSIDDTGKLLSWQGNETPW